MRLRLVIAILFVFVVKNLSGATWSLTRTDMIVPAINTAVGSEMSAITAIWADIDVKFQTEINVKVRTQKELSEEILKESALGESLLKEINFINSSVQDMVYQKEKISK